MIEGVNSGGSYGADGGSTYVRRLTELDRDHTNLVGGKAANLGELSRNGFPVPQGFALTAKAYHRFLDSNGLRDKINGIIAAVNLDDIGNLRNASNDISNLIMGASLPDLVRNEIKEAYEELSVGREIKGVGGAALDMIKAGRGQAFVAVRSSPTSDVLSSSRFAGQLAFVLGIQGREQLYGAVKRCWAGLFSPHMIFFLKKNGFDGMLESGVVIQKMVESDKSGIMFTINPSSNNPEEAVIEATLGYGDSLPLGLIIPDRYVVNKITGKFSQRKAGKKKWLRRLNPVSGEVVKENVDRSRVQSEALDEQEILRLINIAKKVEEHYGTPQDIEWVSEKGRLFLLQSRSLSRKGLPATGEDSHYSGKAIIEGLPASSGKASGIVRVVSGPEEAGRVSAGDVLVTGMTSQEMLPVMSRAAAVVTNDGGTTCHAAVTCRELGIPCVTATDMGTSVLAEGQRVTVNGNSGKITEAADEPVAEQQQTSAGVQASPENPQQYHGTHPGQQKSAKTDNPESGPEQYAEIKQPVSQPEPSISAMEKTDVGPQHLLPDTEKREQARQSFQSLPSMTSNSDKLTATDIMVNISSPGSNLSSEMTSNSDGVGLLKAEHILTENGKHPYYLARINQSELVRLITEGIEKVAKAFYPKPVWYRILDARTDEFRELEGGQEELQETNPLLGWHGTRRSIMEQQVFRAELMAIKRLMENGMGNVGIILPFVTSPEELRKARDIIRESGLQAKLGISVETPSAALKIDDFIAEGLDFVSINLGTMTQLALGVDRNNSKVARLYSEVDKGVLDLVKFVAIKCKRKKIEVSITGEACCEPPVAELLVNMGISSISTDPDVLEEIRKTVARMERRMLLEKMRE